MSNVALLETIQKEEWFRTKTLQRVVTDGPNPTISDMLISKVLAKAPNLVPPDCPRDWFQQTLYPDGRASYWDDRRHDYVKKHGFVLLPKELLEAIVDICRPASYMSSKKVLEVGAGTGTLGGLLRSKGVDITLSDISQADGTGDYGFECNTAMDIVADMNSIPLEGYDIIILTWSGYNDPCAEKFLSRMLPGQMLIHNGESCGGCTETDEFHHALQEHPWEYQRHVSERLQDVEIRFPGIHDSWSVYQKIE